MQENTRDISIIKQRILQFAEYESISKYELYQKTGISNGVFSQKGGISEDNLLRFLSYYSEVSPEWLLTGKGSMLKDSINFEIKEAPQEEIKEPTDEKTHSELNKYAIDSMIKRIESLSIENAALKNEVGELQKKKNYDENGKLSIASES